MATILRTVLVAVVTVGLLDLGSTALGQEAKAARTDADGDPLPPRALVRLGTTRLRQGNRVTAEIDRGDGTVLLWDVADLSRQAAENRLLRLTGLELYGLWADLGGAAAKAHDALWKLARCPEAVPYLRARLPQVPPPDEQQRQRIERLIADLGSEQFAVRQQAEHGLQELGETAGAALHRAQAAEGLPLEVRQRLERLTAPLDAWRRLPEGLRALRAVEALEQTHPLEARQLLEALAQGASESPLTREARASLRRLAKWGR
jgi:hypothetical protein